MNKTTKDSKPIIVHLVNFINLFAETISRFIIVIAAMLIFAEIGVLGPMKENYVYRIYFGIMVYWIFIPVIKYKIRILRYIYFNKCLKKAGNSSQEISKAK